MSDFIDASLAFLPEQFKGRPKIAALLTALLSEPDFLWDVLQDMLTKRDVYTAEGVYLDRIGKIVGEARNGLDDDVYRLRILARIAVHRSTGQVESLLKVARLVIGDALNAIAFGITGQIIVQTEGTKTVVVTVTGEPLDADVIDTLFEFLNKARASGTRLILQTMVDIAARSFTMGTDSYLVSGGSIGSTTLVVDSTAGFPVKGSLDIDVNAGSPETVTYNGILSDRFLNVSPLTTIHAAGTCVQLSDSNDTGYGYESYVTVSFLTGATSITVDSTDGFPASGTLQVHDTDLFDAPGTGNLTYSSKTSTTFTITAAPSGHPVGAVLRPTVAPKGGQFIADRDPSI